MCFHLSATAKAKTLTARFKADFPKADIFKPAEAFNAFTHPLLPVITGERSQQIDLLHWGLVPSWVKNETMAQKLRKSTLNARIETAFEKPSFRDAMRFKRCIIPATSFYEWQMKIEDKHESGVSNKSGLFDLFGNLIEDKSKEKSEKRAKVEKIKYKISTDQEVFAFAGIWDTWQEWSGFSILTMPANPLMAEIHNTAQRMPFILKPENEMKWLDPERVSIEHLNELILPYPEEKMQAERTSQ